MRRILISPSILASDFGNLQRVVEELESCKADSIHIDVMDGVFVPNITVGPVVISAIRNATTMPFETHLMIEHPDLYIKNFADAGSDTIIVHYESKHDLGETIKRIRACNKRAGVSINPETDFDDVKDYLRYVDVLLIMAVNPGFGGQVFMPAALEKIKEARGYIDENGYSTIIAVDGGIDLGTGKMAVDAGADELIAGSAIFGSEDIPVTISKFKELGSI